MSSRGWGKSFSASGLISSNFLFDGCHDYDLYQENVRLDQRLKSETVVGAIDAKYSKDLLDKVKVALENLPDSHRIREGKFEMKYPSLLAKDYSGSFEPSKVITATDSKSTIHHRTLADNPLVFNGTRPNRIFIDECLAPGTSVRMADLSVKNIEDIIIGDLVLGADGKPKEVERVVSGSDLMYKVSQKRGCDYIVNSKHLLYVEQRCNVKDITDDGIKLIRAE